MICLNLFLSFLQIGCFAIGGGYAAMPLIQSQVVTANGWLTMDEFANLVTIAEMTPGPIVVNAATFVGNRLAGIPGACAATFGSILPSMVLLSLFASFYFRYKNISILQTILGYLRPAVVALIASAGLMILLQVMFTGLSPAPENLNFIGCFLFVFALLILRWKKCNPILVMLLCGGANLLFGILFA